MEDVSNMSRLLAGGDAKISFNGLQPKSSSNNTEVGLAVLNYLSSKMAGDKKNHPKNFDIYQSQMALEDPKKGAMIIYPNAEDLKDLVGTKDLWIAVSNFLLLVDFDVVFKIVSK